MRGLSEKEGDEEDEDGGGERKRGRGGRDFNAAEFVQVCHRGRKR